MRYGSIYVATNTVTGEQYVGQTRQRVERRWKCHVNTANSSAAKKYELAKAIIQYGEESIKFEEIYAAFDSKELDAAEMNYIDWLKPAYNKTKGGAGHRGVICSDRLKKARSAKMTELWSNPEWKALQVAKLKVAGQSEEAKERGRKASAISAAVRLAKCEKKEKAIKCRSTSIKNSWKDESIRTKRINGLNKYLQTQEGKLKRSLASAGRKHSQSTKDKISRSKLKPVYCHQLECCFISQKDAADFLGVLKSSVNNAIRQKGKVLRKYTFEMVA